MREYLLCSVALCYKRYYIIIAFEYNGNDILKVNCFVIVVLSDVYFFINLNKSIAVLNGWPTTELAQSRPTPNEGTRPELIRSWPHKYKPNK